MSLVSQTIKNLVAGISQQPAILRHAEQLEHQENAMSTEVSGLQKRPPTVHVATLDNILESNIKPLVHLIDRDESEKYIVVFNGNGVHVWDLKGNKKTVNYEGNSLKYVTTEQPRRVLKVITVADYTFITNTNITARMTKETTPDVWETQGALFNVKSGQYGRTYRVYINGVHLAAYTTPDGSGEDHSKYIDTNYIAGQLASQLRDQGYTVTRGESWFYVKAYPINSVDARDGFNNQALFGVHKSVQRFSMLPASAPDGFTIEVTGEAGNDSDNYYIAYNTSKNVWEETAKPGILNTINATTMPHVLIREANGTFTLKTAEWLKRTTGDDDSNPLPSFIDQKINDMFFFRNRLGVAAGENVVLSCSGDFFNFWVASAVGIEDTDSIDIAVSHNSVSTIHHAVPFNEELLLFSARTQFVLRAEGVLSPKTAAINQVTEFDSLVTVRPVGAGKNIYFPAERDQYSSLKEYYAVQDVSNIKNAQDITAHVPSLIPNGIHKLICNNTENIILALTQGAEDKIYVYKYLFIDEQRLQSAWSYWSFGSTARILGGGFIKSTLYLLIQRDSGVFLEKMTFTYNTKDVPEELYRVFMDRKIVCSALPEWQYDDVLDETYINLDKVYGITLPNETYGLVTSSGYFKEITQYEMNNSQCRVLGNLTGQKVIIGQLFNFKVIFSEIMVKWATERGTQSATEGRLQVKNFWVDYVESGYFKVIVEHFGKQKYSYEMTARLLGANETVLGKPAINTGKFKFPVQSVSNNCQITLESDSPLPVSLSGAGWEGNYIRRNRRIG